MSDSRNLDETFDTVFCRPLANPFARLLSRTPVTANQVTLLSALVGAVAGLLYAFPGWGPAYGALLLLAMMVLDCTDGALARMRGGGTWQGRVLDGVADLVSTFSVHLGMCIALTVQGASFRYYHLHVAEIWMLGLAAGVSLSWNAAVLDGLKQRLNPRSVDGDLERYAEDVRGPLDRLLYGFMTRYAKHIGRAAGRPTDDDHALLRRVQWVGPTHHHLWLVVAGLLAPTWPGVFIGYLIFAIVPANLYLLTVILHARSAAARLTQG